MEEPFVMVNLSETALVVKSNPIMEGRFPKSLTPREMDLLTTLFTAVDPKSGDFSTIRIQIRDLIKLFGLENSNSAYERIAEISKQLLTRVVQIRDKEKNTLTQFQWLSHAEYIYNEGYAEYRFHDKLKPHLIEFSVYAKYVLGPFLALDSFYAKRIYELVIQYRNTATGNPKRWERKLTLEELRPLLGLEKGEYAKYANFKMRILEISRRQITERTDITLEYEEIKIGRGVGAIRFIATENNRPTDILHDPTLARLAGRLMGHGVNEDTARDLVREFGPTDPAWMAEACDNLERRMKGRKGEKPDNPAGWLIAEIRRGRPQMSLFEQEEREARERAKRSDTRRSEIDATLEPARAAYREARRAKVVEYGGQVDAMPKPARVALHDAFRDHLAKQPGGAIFAPRFVGGQSWTDAGILPHAVAFLREQFDDFDLPATEQDYAESNGLPNYAELMAEKKRLES
jgi:hypothetical protein